MAKRKPHEQHLHSSLPYIAVLSVVAIIVFLLTQTQRNLQLKSELEQRNITRTELMAKGINPDPISIRNLSLDQTWQMGNFSYQVRNGYLMSDIADFGDRRTELKIGSENNFLAIQVDVAYIKEMGQKQDINVNQYVRVMANGKAYSPVSADTLQLGPNQNTTAFVIFAVPMNASEFSLNFGGKTTKLDFSSDKGTTMEGVFLTSEGYKPQF